MLETFTENALAAEVSLRRPAATELARLERWLDAGLRRGEVGRLAAEYPLTMGSGGSRRHQCVYVDQRPVAHAMSHTVNVCARGRRLRVGMVGNVFTQQGFRRRGLASACIEAAVGELRQCGASVVLLWSNQRDFYARSGFRPAGRERLWQLSGLGEPRGVGIRSSPARSADLPALEALYASKPVRVDRPRGALARLLVAPRTHVAVARAGDDALGYAVSGRGDDLSGVIHEWAGAPDAVAACVDQLQRAHGAHTLLSAPEPEGLESHLAAAGATPVEGVFALVRILDAERLWRSIAPAGTAGSALHFSGDHRGVTLRDRAGQHALPHELALELFFGTGPAALRGSTRATRRALARLLPWPLYVWGLDSI